MEKLKSAAVFLIAGIILAVSLWYGPPITVPPGFNDDYPPKLFVHLHSFLWLFFSASLVLMLCKKITLRVFLSVLIGLVIVPIGGILELIRTNAAKSLLPFEHSLPDRVADVIYYFINDIRINLILCGLIAMLCHYIISVLSKHNPRKTIPFYTLFFMTVCSSIWRWQFSDWGVSIYHIGIFIFSAGIASIIVWREKNSASGVD